MTTQNCCPGIHSNASAMLKKTGLLLTACLIFLNFSVKSQNPIVIENALPGNPASEWDAGEDYTIQGFATELGVNKGNTVHFKINSANGEDFEINIYRLGYYNGDGARLQATLGPFTGIVQPTPNEDLNTGMVDCKNWTENAHWDIPSTAVSGIYIAKMTTIPSGNTNVITFIVRDDANHSALLYKTADGTWQAYNSWGGRNFYGGSVSGNLGNFNHAVKLSYQRPVVTRASVQDYYRVAELPLIRWMERNGYDVTYTTQLDMSITPMNITPADHKVLISCGHDEYWNAQCRTNWETARNNGVNLCFLSGNEIYWKTRLEDAGTTLVCFKEGTMGENNCGGSCDPSQEWTGLWRDGCGPGYAGAANDACNPENQLSGQISWMPTTGNITVPDTYKDMRFWKHTAVASLAPGQTVTLTAGSLGSEWDQYQYPSTYPSRRIMLSSTQNSGATHNLSLYRHPSGALVFGAGTIHWSWGLDAVHDGGGSPEDPNIQQAMVNLFAYMGVPPDPAQLQAGLFPETGATSNTPPTTVITSPLNGSTLSTSTVTITGTCSGPSGAVIAGVEVSTDGGATWTSASGTANWTYSWNPGSQGTFVIKARAWDDLGNVETPGVVGSPNCVSITFNGPSVYSVFTPNLPGVDPVNGSGAPLEVGMRFKAGADGYITSLRYYKIAGTTGEHTGHLWTNAGVLLATATFTNETASGWQTVTLPVPVPITANTLYVVSYFSPSGQYPSSSLNYFTTDVVNFLLTAPAAGNGLYLYTPVSAFPSSNTLTNYWVDVTFATQLGPDETPPSVISINPLNNATGVSINVHPVARFGEVLDPLTVNSNTFIITGPGNTPVAGTVSYNNGNQTVTFTPDAPLAYSTTYTLKLVGGASDPRIKDPAGNALAADFIWTFTTENQFAPSITLQPVSQSSCSGNSVSFSTTATGNPIPTLQWELSTDGGNSFSPIPGATTSPYTFTPALSDNNNQYRAVWTNTGGNATSNVATLTVVTGITGSLSAVNSSICPDGTIQLQLNGTTGQAPFTAVVNGKTYTGITPGTPFATIPTGNESIWPSGATPSSPDESVAIPYELGLKFRPVADGFIKGVRFYKGVNNTGTHVGHLWTAGGSLLASVTFVNETASGWQQALFSSPVAVTANTNYVISYTLPVGYFSQSINYFITNTPVTSANGLVQTLPATGNGVYSGTPGAFPNQTPPLLTNYWVDVVYSYANSNTTLDNKLTSLSDNGTCTITGNPVSNAVVSFNNPAAPAVISPVLYAQGAVASALTATGTNLLWYTTPTGGTGSSVAPVPSTAIQGTTSYYVSQTNSGCESARSQIDVIVTGLSGWYNASWHYRRPSILTNTCGNTLTDYQVQIVLNNSFDFNKAKADGSDIRVTDADGTTPIPFWIESWDAGNQLARIWIKVPSIPTGGSVAYIYYGNETASSVSNGSATFMLFDDDWTSPIWSNTGTPTVSGGVITFGLGQAIQSLSTFMPGTAIGLNVNFKGAANYKWAGFITGSASPFTVLEVDPLLGSNLIMANEGNVNPLKVSTSLGPVTNAFHVYELGWLTAETRAYKDHVASPAGILNSQIPTGPLPAGVNNFLDVANPMDVDWIYVRKFSNCEPTYVLGDEQTQCPPALPAVTTPVNYCKDAAATALSATGSSLLWYTQPVSGSGSATAPVPSTTTTGTTSYYVTQTVNGCESLRAEIVVNVNPVPDAPAASVTDPTCNIPSGTITVTSATSGLTFSIDGFTTYNNTGVFTLLNPGSYNLVAKNNFGCVSPATPLVVNAVPGAPDAPTASVTQPTCITAYGTISITAPTGAGMTYSVDGLNYSSATVYSSLAPGTYPVTAKDATGCISTITFKTVNALLTVPGTPTASVTQPTCSVATGTISVTSSVSGLSFSIDGNTYSNTTGIFSGLLPGNYTLTAKNGSGCISGSLLLTVNAAPAPPTATIAAVNPNLCYGDGTYQLQLTAASGQSPFSLVVNGVTYPNITVGQTFVTLPVDESFWNNNEAGIITANDPAGYELGMKFRTTVNGFIRGVRFHKSAGNTGTHVGSLWTITGTKLASATYTNETATGWQEVIFSAPVAVTANTVYVVSYSDPNGFYDRNTNYFVPGGVTSGHLYALSNSDASPPLAAGNSVYVGVPGGFPVNPTGTNYWIDVVFSTSGGTGSYTIPNNLTSITTASGCNATGNPLSTATVTVNPKPIGTISAAGPACNGGDMNLVFNATTGTGPFSLVINGNTINNISSGVAFNAGTGTNPAQSIFPATAAGITQNADPSSVELGVKFRSNVGGQVTGIRFYKSSQQTGTFTGSLWSSGGTNLATATFTTTTSGWQEVLFSSPVTILPNTTYVASYHTPTGHYFSEVNYFASAGVTNGALTALQSGVDGTNGVYNYSASTAFPNSAPQHTNYWVDVVFVPSVNNYFALSSITSSNGCVTSVNPPNGVSVPVFSGPTANATAPAINCYGGTTVVTVTATGGTAPYTGTGTFTVTAGTYNYTVTDANGCSAVATITIGQPSAVVASSSATTINCYGGSSTVTVSATGGTPPYAGTGNFTVSAGTYNYTVTDANGCTSTTSVTVGQPAAPVTASGTVTNISCFGAANGAINLTVTGGTGIYTYEWTGPNGFQTQSEDVQSLAPGTYTVIITESNGCTVTGTTSFTITQPDALAVVVTGTNVPCDNGNTGTASAAVSGGTAPYLYAWSNGSTDASISGLIPGTYTVIITDAHGCPTSGSYTVAVADIIAPVINCPATLAFYNVNGGQCSATLSFEAAATDNCGVAGIVYKFGTTPITFPYAFPVGSTTVTATATDLHGLTSSCNFTVVVVDNQAPVITCPEPATVFNANAGQCYSTQSFLAVANDNCGVASVIYKIGATEITFPYNFPVGGTTVTVIATDIHGLTSNCSFNVAVVDNQAPVITCPTPAVSYNTDAGVCTASLSFTATATDNCGVAGIIYKIGSSVISFPYDFPAGTTTVTAIATDIHGTTSSCTFDVTVADNQAPVILCPATLFSYNADAGECNATLSFTASASDNCGSATIVYKIGSTPITFPYDFPVGSTTVTATATDIHGLSSSCNFTVVVVDNQLPTITCPANVIVFANAGQCYATGVNLGTPITSDNCNVATISNDAPAQFPAGNTTVTWTVTDSHGNSSTCTQIVTVNSNTTITATAGPNGTISPLGTTTLSCGGSQTYTIVANPGYVIGDVLVDGSSVGAVNTYTFTNVTANHTIHATFKLIVSADPALVDIRFRDILGSPINANLIPLNSVNKIVIPVLNLSQTATSIIPAGTTRLKIDLGTKLIVDPGFTLATAPLNNYFSWTETIESGHVVIYGGQILDIPANFVDSVIFNVKAITAGTSLATADFLVTNHNNSTQFLVDELTGNNHVAATYHILSAFSISFDNKTDLTCYGVSTGTITVHATGGATPYQFSIDGGTTWLPAGGTAGAYTFTGLAAGTYTVTARDFIGQLDNTAPVTITQPTQITLTATGSSSDVLCNGGNTGAINLTATAANGTPGYTYAYTWSASNGGFVPVPQVNNEDLTGLVAGDYSVSVTVTDANGCTRVFNNAYSVNIAEPLALAAGTTGTDANCFGGNDGTVNLTVTGGTMPYSYSWTASNGGIIPAGQADDEDLSGLTAGTYTVTVTDDHGCTTTAFYVVGQPAQITLVPAYTATPVNCNGGNDGAINLTANAGGGTPGYTYAYSWTASNGGSVPVAQVNNEDLSGLTAGDYTVSITVTDNHNCVRVFNNILTITIGQPTALAATAAGTPVACFGGTDGTASVTVGGGSPGYTYAWTGPGGYTATTASIIGLAAGVYNVVVTDTHGCFTNASFEVLQPAQLVVTATGTSISCFGGNNGTASATVTGGTVSYSYTWTASGGGIVPPGQEHNPSLTGLITGVYTVVVTDGHSCTASDSYTVTQPAAITLVSAPDLAVTHVTCNGSGNGSIDLSFTAQGGTPGYTYTYAWTRTGGGFSATTQDISGLAPGTYNVTITVTDANLCTATFTGSATVTEPPVLNATVTATTQITCAGSNSGSVTVTATGGTPGYQYQLDGGQMQSSGTFSGIAAGTHIVNAVDANGCTKPVTFTITEPLNTDVTIGSNFTNNLFPVNGTDITVVYNLTEIAGKAATPATIRIFKPAGYTISFNPLETSIVIFPATIALDNGNWTQTASTSLYVEYSRSGAGYTIPCNQRVNISFRLIRNTPNKSTFNLNAQFRAATGEVLLGNNTNSILLVGE